MKLRMKTKMFLVIIFVLIIYIILHMWFIDKTIDLNNRVSDKIIAKTGAITKNLRLDRANFSKEYLYFMTQAIEDTVNVKGSIDTSKPLSKVINFPSALSNSETASFIIIKDGKILSSSKKSEIGQNFYSWTEKYPKLYNFFNEKLENRNDHTSKVFRNDKMILIVRQIPKTDYYIIGAINYKSVKYKPTLSSNSNKLLDMYVIQQMTNMKNNMSGLLTYHFITASMIFAVCLIILWYMFTSITKPITVLRSKLRKIGSGDFDIHMDEHGSAETVDLIRAFNFMGGELKEYMNHLRNETVKRESIESEIKIAGSIQRSCLPIIDKTIIRPEFSIYSKLDPALDAAGDFYDFFFVSENKLAITIADVAGKGISAAFFMALSKTILQYICLNEPSPANALNRLNNILSTNNRNCMFVTIFLIYYDIKTGEITYANGGHHESFIINSEKELRKFGVSNSLAVGVQDSYIYKEGKEQLKFGDTLILYTDGMTEALSPHDNEFGDKNFINKIKDNILLTPRLLCEKLIKTVRRFEKNNRFDDITVLILKRNGK
ncbi:MAG TPA: SpoIIE family protein phosphatase [Victivallales bacterium]|nr:SpoIIE family protein phosphatase [Victivallales bacterium]